MIDTADDGFILRANENLKRKFGGSVDSILTDSKVKLAEKVLDENSEALINRCIEDAKKMREFFSTFNKDLPLTKEDINQLKLISLGIKSMAGQAGYPIASDIARSMFEFIDKLETTDKKSYAIISLHIDSIYAVFAENKAGLEDAVSQEVLNQLKAVVSKA